MMLGFKKRFEKILQWSERYTKTDMVYLVKNSFWLTVGQIASVLISLSIAIAFGHLAQQDTYGNYKYVLTIAGLLGTITLSGLGTSIMQSVARGFEGTLKQGVRLNFNWSIGIIVLSFIGSAYYHFFQKNDFLAIGFIIIGVSSPFLNGYSLFDAFLIGKKEFKKETIYSVLDLAIPTAAIIITLFFTQRAIILICIYFLVNTLSAALFYYLTLQRTKNQQEDPDLLHYSGHLSIMNIIGTIGDKLDSLIIFWILGPTQLAVYAYAIAMPEQIKALIKNIPPLALPKFSERSITEIKENIWIRTFYLFILVLIIILLYILIAPYVFRIFFPIYIKSISYSQWYALSIVITTLAIPFTSIFQAHKKTRALYLSSNFSSLVLIVSLAILTPLYGIIGAILSQFIYRIVSVVLTLWQFSKLAAD